MLLLSQFLEKGWLNENLAVLAGRVDTVLGKFNDDQHQDFWTVGVLRTSPVWEEVRRLALQTLCLVPGTSPERDAATTGTANPSPRVLADFVSSLGVLALPSVDQLFWLGSSEGVKPCDTAGLTGGLLTGMRFRGSLVRDGWVSQTLVGLAWQIKAIVEDNTDDPGDFLTRASLDTSAAWERVRWLALQGLCMI
jgi:hypothetical protein